MSDTPLSVVYRQGAVSPKPPVYGSFAAALAAIRAYGAPGRIFFDGSLGQCVLPATAIDASDTIWSSASGQFVIVNMPDGSSFTRLPKELDGGLNINWQGTSAPAFVSTDAFGLFHMYGNSGVLCDAAATQSFIHVTAGVLQILADGASSFFNNHAASALVEVTLPGQAQVILGLNATLTGGRELKGNGGFTIYPGCQNLIAAQPGVTGTVDVDNAPQELSFELDLTLIGGTKTLASGRNMTRARLMSVRLKTPNTAVGMPQCTFVAGPNGAVTVTSFDATGVQLAADVSTYTASFVGVGLPP